MNYIATLATYSIRQFPLHFDPGSTLNPGRREECGNFSTDLSRRGVEEVDEVEVGVFHSDMSVLDDHMH